ncbi:MAG TPA: VC0807 family protein [Oceanipulchritudo sp.]|nr:VC0807 family protein [Oceanipulchritudo sp.]
MGSANPQSARRENGFHSLLFNILLPVILLTQGDRLISHPASVLVIALVFPVGYFLWDYNRRKKVNFVSILGFVSVLLTGGVGLMQLPRFWFVVKETAIPALIGIAVLASLFTRYPLIRMLVFSKEIFDVDHIHKALEERNSTSAMERLLRNATLLLSVSFFLSAALNLVLANHFVQTEPKVDPARFNAEVGAMTGWSYLVIALPSTLFLFGILYMVIRGIRKHAGLGFEESLSPHLREEKKD